MVSLVFRLWLTELVPQPFVYDQGEYERYANYIYHNPWLLASHTYRTYPYSLFIAVIYRLTYLGNHEAVIYSQIILDSLVSLFIYFILVHGVNIGRWAWLGAILYAINPITSGYLGVLLSEPITTFFCRSDSSYRCSAVEFE